MDLSVLIALLGLLFGVPATIVAILQITDRARQRQARTKPPLLAKEDVARPYMPYEPVEYYPQPRETRYPRIAATLIIVVLLLIMGVAAIFTVRTILSGVSPSPSATATTGPGGGSPTIGSTTTPTSEVHANITVNPLTLTATNGSSTSDCDYWNSYFGSSSGWTCGIRLQNNGQNMVNWRATAPSDVDLQPSSTGFLEAGGNWTLHVHIPLKDCPGSITITITPDGGTSQNVVWTCS
jgi:hypothetical protein